MIMLAPALMSTGCAETNIQGIQRLRPAYSLYRNALANVIVDLPPVGSINAWTMPSMLFPAPTFYEDRMNDPTATAEIIYFGEQHESVRLSIRSPIDFCLGWTGPKNPLSPEVWNDRGGLGEECDAALKRPWLVLLRVAESALPKRLRMEVFLIYVPQWKVVGSFPMSIYGRSRQDGRPTDSELTSAFHQAASCELLLSLNKLPGGNFHFDYRRCDGDFLSIAVPASLAPEIAGQ